MAVVDTFSLSWLGLVPGPAGRDAEPVTLLAVIAGGVTSSGAVPGLAAAIVGRVAMILHAI
jgi:hypothetical protein